MASGDLMGAAAQWPMATACRPSAIIQRANQDQQEPWLASLASLSTP